MWTALGAVVALVVQGETLNRLHRRFGGAPIPLRHRWVASSLFLVAPLVLASTLWRSVEWRGRAYDLGRSTDTRLAGAELGSARS
jgi:hypothetical protein